MEAIHQEVDSLAQKQGWISGRRVEDSDSVLSASTANNEAHQLLSDKHNASTTQPVRLARVRGLRGQRHIAPSWRVSRLPMITMVSIS